MTRAIAAAALAALAAAIASPAGAQTPIHEGTPMILYWRGEEQARGFRTIEKIYKTDTVRRGPTVHRFRTAAQQISPRFEIGGKAFTVDDYMTAYRVSGLLVIRDGEILMERYGLGRTQRDRWTSFSVAKSLTSTLVGAAIKDGKIKGLDAQVVDYIPELKGSAYEGVTVRQMLTMSSGVKWNEDYADPQSDVAKAGFKALEPGVDPMVSYLARLPRAHAPGSVFNYNTGETDLVGVLVSNAVGKSLADYASEKIWKPFGMEQDAVWMTDLGGRDRGGCCISMTLRDYGRIGAFILGGGRAEGHLVVPDDWVKEATRVEISDGAPPPAGYGYFWWVTSPERFDAVGIFGQSITLIPKERLIVVQNAAWPTAVGKELSAARAAFIEAVRKEIAARS